MFTPRAPKRKATSTPGSVKKPKATRRRKATNLAIPSTPELKSYNSTIGAVGLSTTPQYLLLNGIAEGDDYTNRNGRKYVITQVQYDVLFSVDVTSALAFQNATSNGYVGRFLIVYDKQTNGAAFTYNQLMDQGGGATRYNPQGHRNMSYSQRFVVLVDEQPVLDYSGGLTQRLKGIRKVALPVQCIGTGSTGGDIGQGSLYAVYLDNNLSGANNAIIVGTYKLNFYDV